MGALRPIGGRGADGAAGAAGAAGPAPSGTGLVSVTGGVLDTPSTLAARLAADAAALRTALATYSAAEVDAAIAAAVAAQLRRSIATSTLTANAGGGTAVAATGTLTLPGATTTSSWANTPRLTGAHGGDAFAFDVAIRIAAFTGATNNQTMQALIAGDGATLPSTAWMAQVRVYGAGQIDFFAGAAGTALTVYVDSTLALDGQDWIRVRVAGGYTTLWTGRGATYAAAVWTLRYVGATGKTLPVSAAVLASLTLSLNAVSGAPGTVTATWADVTWGDVT